MYVCLFVNRRLDMIDGYVCDNCPIISSTLTNIFTYIHRNVQSMQIIYACTFMLIQT